MRLTDRCAVRVVSVVLVAVFAAGGVARAQDDDTHRTALARSLFLEGVAHSDREAWPEAADRFRRSLVLRDSPIVAFNLATALVHVGRLVEAAELFRRAAADPRAPERVRRGADQQLALVEPRLGRLTIEIVGPREGVALEIDQHPLMPELVGVEAPADPGLHVLRALRNQTEVARAEVEVPENGARSVTLTIPSPERTARAAMERRVSPERAPAAPAGSDDTWVWVGVIAAVLVVGGAAALTSWLVLDSQSSLAPIEGNLGPAVIVFE